MTDQRAQRRARRAAVADAPAVPLARHARQRLHHDDRGDHHVEHLDVPLAGSAAMHQGSGGAHLAGHHSSPEGRSPPSGFWARRLAERAARDEHDRVHQQGGSSSGQQHPLAVHPVLPQLPPLQRHDSSEESEGDEYWARRRSQSSGLQHALAEDAVRLRKQQEEEGAREERRRVLNEMRLQQRERGAIVEGAELRMYLSPYAKDSES